MASDIDIQGIAGGLFACLREQRTMAPIVETYPDIDIDDAYRISRAFLALREAAGEQVIGKKIGVTSAAVQEMLGVFQPDFGFLTDAMWVQDGVVDTQQLIAPRAEAEIAFKLSAPLVGPGITGADVLAATESVMPCFEIVDSRIQDWRISICDTVADNASCGVFVMGEACPPTGLDLSALTVSVTKNGEPLSEGAASEVQGAPENAVAWLANTLGGYGIPFEAGEFILSGSMVPLAPAVKGDQFEMHVPGLGSASVRFD